jgi:hypothetical protein
MNAFSSGLERHLDPFDGGRAMMGLNPPWNLSLFLPHCRLGNLSSENTIFTVLRNGAAILIVYADKLIIPNASRG